MAGNNAFKSKNKDSMDINELASLNDDISPELIEQLQQKLEQSAQGLDSGAADIKPVNPEFNTNDDAALFEEPQKTEQAETTQPDNAGVPSGEPKEEIKEEKTDSAGVEAKKEEKGSKQDSKNENEQSKKNFSLDKSFDDNFIKKYKAKLNKQKTVRIGDQIEDSDSNAKSADSSPENADNGGNIEDVSQGKISEKALTQEQKDYNDSLDFLDGNVKYSKYVIYVDPQNAPFIESLTVKERKNLINKILREQDDIAITKHRFKVINTVIRHAVISILTLAISIPAIYFTINASLEATINNYRRSQTIFQTLYRQNGKINIK